MSLQNCYRFIASGLGVGFIPGAPGTYGSILALGLYYFIAPLSLPLQLMLTVIVFVLGWTIAGQLIENTGDIDPGWIVIDEMVAVWMTLITLPASIWWWLAGFAIFRGFDIAKPWPIRTIEHQLPPALALMVDDVMAAVYTVGILQLVRCVL